MRRLHVAGLAVLLLAIGCQRPGGPSGSADSVGGAAPAPGPAAPAPAHAAPPEPPAANAQEALKSKGKELYVKYCQLCHGEDGAGYKADHANQLRNPLFLATASEDFMAVAIERGRAGTAMAAYHADFGGPLNDEDVNALIAYTYSLSQLDLEKAVVSGSVARGAPLYRKHCATCHGDQGQGKTALSLNNPYFLATASDGYLRYAIEHGRPGTPMAGFQGKLAPAQLDDVTRYIRSLARTIEDTPEGGEPLPGPERLVVNPSGPAPRFSPLREGRYVPAKEVHAALKAGARMIILDARPPSDWIKSHIVGAFPAPYYGLGSEFLSMLPRDGTWIVAYCGCPHAASGKVMDKLRAEGFQNTAVLDEGIFEWARMKLPTMYGRAK
jgi:cytochrome c oxidase cbb3-type subunit 3